MRNTQESQNELSITTPNPTTSAAPTASTARLSRRTLLGWAAQGTLALAAATLLNRTAHAATLRTPLERMLPGARELGAQPIAPISAMAPLAGGLRAMSLGDSSLGFTPSLPMWGDGIQFNQPEYYETLCVGDVDGDGQDELIIRGPAGILVHRFDSGSGQWLPILTNTPFFSDADGWGDPMRYKTIQCADVDYDDYDEIVGRGPDGIVAYKYNTTTQTFELLKGGSCPLADNGDGGIWAQEAHYSTLKWGKNPSGNGLHFMISRYPDGLRTWYYAAEVPGWYYTSDFKGPWPDIDSDGTNWTLPQYYETIRFADIDGDGRDELIARSASGIKVYKFEGGNDDNNFKPYGAPNGILSDASGWSLPEYYSTIQFADIDGDKKYELLARGAAGIYVYKWNSDKGSFDQHSLFQGWTDASGGNAPQYYSTIQCGDVDGDGADEIVGRSSDYIVTIKYDSEIGWYDLGPQSPYWQDDGVEADSNGTKWNQVEYYSTIRLVRTHADTRLLANPNCTPIHGNTSYPYAALIGRDKYGIQTWRFQEPTPGYMGGYYVPTSAPMPDFTSPNADADYRNGYAYLTNYWALSNGLRNNYNNTEWGDPDFQDKKSALFSPAPGNYYQSPIPTPSLAKPSTVSDPAKWQAMCWQLYWEMVHVEHIRHLFGVDMDSLISALQTGDQGTLSAVQDYLSIPQHSGSELGINLLAFFGNMLWAILGIPGIAGEIAGEAVSMATESAIAGIMGTLFGELGGFIGDDGSGDGSFYGTLAQLQTALDNNYLQARTMNATTEYYITGGNVLSNGITVYNDGHWGPLFAFGQMIASGILVYPEKLDSSTGKIVPDNVAMVESSQPYNAVKYWQALIPGSSWQLGYQSGYDDETKHLPDGYPSQYTITEQLPNPNNPHSAPDSEIVFLSTSSSQFDDYPDPATLSALFDGRNTDPSSAKYPFPLGVSLNDVFLGQNGWPTLSIKNWGYRQDDSGGGSYDGGMDGVVRKAAPVPLKAYLELTPTLTKSDDGKKYVVKLSVRNRGMAAATNVEIVSATLGSAQPLAPVNHKRKRLAQEDAFALDAHFPIRAGQSGQTVVLRVQGQHKTGTFGGTFRVKLP